jgi:flagellar biosynthesis/type III secretory pathway M-ring protein FliF/YscJ
VAPDLDNTNYWIGSMVFYGLILFIMIIAMFNVCCKDYDPLNEFESRRKKQAKGRKLEDEKVRKEELKRKKEINKKNWAKGKFSNIDEEEQEEEDDTERGLPKKGGK